MASLSVVIQSVVIPLVAKHLVIVTQSEGI